MRLYVTLSRPNRSTWKIHIFGVGTSESGKILGYPTLTLTSVLRPLKAAIKCVLACRVRQCCCRPQAKGNNDEANNSRAFECPTLPEITAGKSSPSRAALGIPCLSWHICIIHRLCEKQVIKCTKRLFTRINTQIWGAFIYLHHRKWKEFVFTPICLFVCLCAGYLKRLWTDSDETWWTGCVCDKNELIRF